MKPAIISDIAAANLPGMARSLALASALGLAGCSSSPDRFDVPVVVPAPTVRVSPAPDASPVPAPAPAVHAVPVASGPISRACLGSNREGRSARLCGCIQAAADLSLTPAQQRRATAFYSDPHLAQEVRRSDRSADERFWKAYSEYGERAEDMCG